MIALKMATFILSLGVDTLILAMSLGFVQTKGKLRIALVFACAEAFMSLFGFVIGQTTGELIGKWTSVIGGVALIAVAIWLIFFDDENDEEEKLRRNLVGWTLVITALSISLDELAVGFSIGFIGVPVGLTICLSRSKRSCLHSLGSPLVQDLNHTSENGQKSWQELSWVRWGYGYLLIR